MYNQEPRIRKQTVKIANNEFYRLVQEELAENGKVCFSGFGNSMLPQIRGGKDKILLRKFDPEKETLKVGDICLFSQDGRYIIHRIIRIQDKRIYLQGDNNLVQIECCRREDIIGVVETIYRDGREIQPESLFWKFRRGIHRLKIRWTGYAARAYRHIKKSRPESTMNFRYK